MRAIHRLILWLITALIPVTIAACYGYMVEYTRSTGRVLDAESKSGIPGIACTCFIGSYEEDMVTSDADGRFELWAYEKCDEIRFEDVDGVNNGGLYEGRRINLAGHEDCEDLTIELHNEDLFANTLARHSTAPRSPPCRTCAACCIRPTAS